MNAGNILVWSIIFMRIEQWKDHFREKKLVNQEKEEFSRVDIDALVNEFVASRKYTYPNTFNRPDLVDQGISTLKEILQSLQDKPNAHKNAEAALALIIEKNKQGIYSDELVECMSYVAQNLRKVAK